MYNVACIEVPFYEHPELMAMLVNGLLFRLGGQQKFTLEELVTISKDAYGIRLVWDMKAEPPTIVVTFKPVMGLAEDN